MSKKDKKQKENPTQEQPIQSEKIIEIENKIEEIIKNLSLLPSQELINEININYQNLKNQFQEQENKFENIQKNIENISYNLTEIERTLLDIQKYKEDFNQKYEELLKLNAYINEILEKLEFLENLKNEYPIIKEKYPLIDHLISQLTNIQEKSGETTSLLEKIKEELLNVERELKVIKDQLETKIEEKITEFFENYQSKVDEAQTLKLIELEDKFNNIIKEVENKTEQKITEYVINVQSQIDSAQTQKILELENKINQIIESYFNQNEQNFNNLKDSLSQYVYNLVNETLLDKINLVINNYKQNVSIEIEDKISQLNNQINLSLSESLENQERKLQELKEKLAQYINDSILEKIGLIINNYKDLVYNEVNEKISQINEETQRIYQVESKLQELINQKINETHSLMQNLIKENETKIQNLYFSLEQNLNDSIEKALTNIKSIQEKNNEITYKIDKLEEKYNDFVNLINNVSNSVILKILGTGQEEVQLTYSESLPYTLNKLIEIMNREDIMADYLIIKSGNRPLLKSSKTIAAIGKNYLKNGDVF
ncbi:MAG: hypothetical protein ACK4GJ_05515, partial [bacterium]